MRVRQQLEVIWYKGLNDFTADSTRAYVGVLWWVLEPALYMSAFYVAFGLGLRTSRSLTAISMLCGLVPWKWFASSIQSGSKAIQVNSGLIQQVYLPKLVLPCIVLVTDIIKFAIVLVLLLLLVMWITNGPTIQWLALPPVIFVELLLIIGITSLCAAIVPLLPDLQLIIDNGLIILMFLSGTIVDVSTLPPKVAAILRFNPMVPVLEAYRDVLIRHQWPQWDMMVWPVAAAFVTYAVALKILKSFDRSYPKLLIS